MQRELGIRLNLILVYNMVKRKLGIIIFCGSLLTVLFSIPSILEVLKNEAPTTPMTEVSTKILVVKDSEDSKEKNSFPNMTDCKGILTSRDIYEEAFGLLNFDIEFDELLSSVKIELVTDTNLIVISVQYEDKERAEEICTVIRDVGMEKLQNILPIQKVEVIEGVNELKSEEIFPNNTLSYLLKKMIMLEIVFCIIAAAAFIILFIFNDLIKDKSDLEYYTNLEVLGVLPELKKKEGGGAHGIAKE
jgi:capsular polysaccharide biosynthesis protein